jgi:hypothetical protein
MSPLRTREAIAAAVALALAGCSSSPADLLDKPSPGSYVELAGHNKYLDHPSTAVRAPASVGLGIGTIVGIPVMIVALPVTLGFGIKAFTDDPKESNLQVLGNAVAWPDAVCAVGGCYAFGALPNLIVGDAPGKAARTTAPPPEPVEPIGPPPARGRSAAAARDPGLPPGIDGDLPPVGKE